MSALPEVAEGVGRYRVGSRWRLRCVYAADYCERWDGAEIEVVAVEGGEGLPAPPSPADFNLDGFVDGNDLAVWQANLGMAGDATTAHGDANGDLNVDGDDLLVWQQQFTGGPPTPAAAVPEPAGLALLLCAAAALPLSRRRRL